MYVRMLKIIIKMHVYHRFLIFIDQIRETLIYILEKWQTIPSDDEAPSDAEAPSDDKMNEIAQCLTPEVCIELYINCTLIGFSSMLVKPGACQVS